MKAVHDEAHGTWSVTDVPTPRPAPGRVRAAIDTLRNDPPAHEVVIVA